MILSKKVQDHKKAPLARLSTPCPGVGDRARVLRTTGKQRLYASIGAQGRRLLKRIWGLSETCLVLSMFLSRSGGMSWQPTLKILRCTGTMMLTSSGHSLLPSWNSHFRLRAVGLLSMQVELSVLEATAPKVPLLRFVMLLAVVLARVQA